MIFFCRENEKCDKDAECLFVTSMPEFILNLSWNFWQNILFVFCITGQGSPSDL